MDPAWFWILLGRYEGDPISLDRWQVAWLRNYNRFRAIEKAPQIGFSWLCALEALWECLMFYDADSGFVSVDQREAANKILYAKKAYYELPDFIQAWVPMLRDSTEQLDFGEPRRPNRLMSLPATSGLRGRKMSVVLDEADFYKDGGRDMFRVALTRVIRGGRVTMGSTCFGVDTQLDRTMQGVCHECGKLEEEHGDANHPYGRVFSRSRLPWTVVEREGDRATIKMTMAELDPADALEEYGCVRGGARTSTFSPELLRECTHELPMADPRNQATLEELGLIPEPWEPSGPAVGGYDPGGGGHPSVLTIIERLDGLWQQTVLWEARGKDGLPMRLPQQQEFLNSLLDRVRTLTLVLDFNGIGLAIGQALQDRWGNRVVKMMPGSKGEGDLPTQDRKEMVTEFKRAMEAHEVELAQDREQAMQFRRTQLLPDGRILQPGSKRRTHYDRFWSALYAWYGTQATRAVVSTYEKHGLTVLRGRG